MTPVAYVARSKALQSVVVAHAGTNQRSLASWMADLDVNMIPVNRKLDKLDTDDDNSRILLHEGFYEVWNATHEGLFEQVLMALTETGYTHVLVTGHSQGAAVAQIEAVAIRNRLPASINVENIGFGSPRVGNENWANFVDRTLGNSQVHVVSHDDIVAQLPPAFLTDYHHAKNEIWIDHDSEQTYLCRGQENDDCAKSIILGGMDARMGPYFGVNIRMRGCDKGEADGDDDEDEDD